MNIIFAASVFLTHHALAQDFSNPGVGSQQQMFAQGFPNHADNLRAEPVQDQPNLSEQPAPPTNSAPQQQPLPSIPGEVPNDATSAVTPALGQPGSAVNPPTDQQTIDATPVKQQPAISAATGNQQNAVNEQLAMTAIPNPANADSGSKLSSSPVKMEQGSDQFQDDHQMQSKEESFENSQDTVLPSSATRDESFQNNPQPSKQETVQSSRVKEGLDDKLGFELKSIVSQIQDMQKEVAEALRDGDDV